MESVLVAAVGAGGPVTLVVMHLLNKRGLRRQIGSPNGAGDLYEIAERIETDVQAVKTKVDDNTARMTGVEARTAGVETRLGSCETELHRVRDRLG